MNVPGSSSASTPAGLVRPEAAKPAYPGPTPPAREPAPAKTTSAKFVPSAPLEPTPPARSKAAPSTHREPAPVHPKPAQEPALAKPALEPAPAQAAPKSLKDIARLLGVSVATVSRVINSKGHFSQETKRRVLAALERYDYTPNLAARGLKTAKTSTIGVLIPDISDDWLSQLIFKLEQQFFEKGYSLFICSSARDPQKEKGLLTSLMAKRIDGLIYVSCREYVPYKEIKNVAARVPLVFMEHEPLFSREELVKRQVAARMSAKNPQSPSEIPSSKKPQLFFDCIESDHYQGAFLATKHLIACGCKRIAFISKKRALTSDILRYQGYSRALKEAGLFVYPQLQLELDAKKPSSTEAEAKLLQVFESGEKIDGIFASNDWRALGALAACRRAGYKVPRDVQVIGFNNAAFAGALDPALSSIEQNSTELARLATERLLKQIRFKKEGRTPEYRHYIIPVSLVERNTTKAQV